MKRVFFLFITVWMMSNLAQAQDEAITDEELNKYVVAMDSIDNMKKTFIETISEMVKNNENVTAARYNDLSKIIDDEAKLQEEKATPEEIAFVKSVAAKKVEETAKINETFQSLAKDYIGVKSYNAIKKALKADPEVKAKYDSMMEQLNQKETAKGEQSK